MASPFSKIMQPKQNYTTPRENGKQCKFNKDCQSECCVVYSNMKSKMRVCTEKSKSTEKCSVGELKGGYHDSFCPCEASAGICNRATDERHGYCS
uniref:Prokineticin domain-containing protein n=1 Tax=Strigamia maritima TaxID=126957 RepID=T1JCS1_STRMM